jgi:hypothetical protein
VLTAHDLLGVKYQKDKNVPIFWKNLLLMPPSSGLTLKKEAAGDPKHQDLSS